MVIGEEVPRGRLVPPDFGGQSNNFNTLRLAMALLVVWSHCFAIWWGSEHAEPISLAMNGIYNAGNIGVLAFFTISGFLISLSWQRSSSAPSYLLKRLARIVPGYVMATVVCSLVVAPILSDRRFGALSGGEAIGLASNFLLRGYIVPTPGFTSSINGALWSIPYEFWCYLGVLALGVTGLLRWRIGLIAGAVAVLVGRVILDGLDRRPGGGLIEQIIGFQYLWFVVLPSFLLGMCVLAYRDRLVRSGALLLVLIVLTLASAWVPLPGHWGGSLTRLLLPPTLAYAIFYVAFHPRWQLGDAAKYGDFSYGCYLYAFPIQQLLKAWLPAGNLIFIVYIAAAMLLSLVAGVVSWFVVERWFERRKRRIAPKPLEEESLLVAP